ncbi:Wadjet anti-phage system protein JetD domain-containing protein [Pseudanabaena minima]|uniref:Wadjet anti-phage system protein JetD domain-containing protein n=1 Tax=Pseudanabaena minima TaxID=890415 RepID=UPI003DA9398B
MINPTDIKDKANKCYSSFLTSLITGESFFSIDFAVGRRPKDFLELRKSVNELIDKSKQSLGYGYILELETTRTQQYGDQSLPKRIFIETEQDYLKLINKQKEVTKFKQDLELIRAKVPELEQWLCRNPLKIVEYSDRWNELLKVCEYFQNNPKPHLYIRELPIQIHTKFIEQNKGIICSLLEAILSIDQLVSVENENEHKFEKRFSLKYKEHQIRIRLLDPILKERYKFPSSDISIPLSEFRHLNLENHPCFITENLMNFLTLPYLPDSFAIFGGGYAVQNLKSVFWLQNCPIFYWGDLDDHGFRILSQLRSYFPQTISLMMDTKTFETFQEFAVCVPSNSLDNLSHLTSEERALHNYLVINHKRLEQERITQIYSNNLLQSLVLIKE